MSKTKIAQVRFMAFTIAIIIFAFLLVNSSTSLVAALEKEIGSNEEIGGSGAEQDPYVIKIEKIVDGDREVLESAFGVTTDCRVRVFEVDESTGESSWIENDGRVEGDGSRNNPFKMSGFVYGIVCSPGNEVEAVYVGELAVSPGLPSAEVKTLEEDEEEIEISIGEAVIEAVIEGCTTLRCRQIDTVWISISSLLSNFAKTSNAGKIWDIIRGWLSFTEVYRDARTEIFPPTTGAPGKPENFDAIIADAAEKENVNINLAKAIMKYESLSDSNAISETGCAGLFQICLSSSPSDIINVQCRQEIKYGPRMCAAGSCRLNDNQWYFCGTCDSDSESSSQCIHDQRFDPTKNIHAGIRILKLKQQAVQSCKAGADLIKCQIAAYNLGEGVVNEAAKNAGAAPSWEEVSNKLTLSLLKKHKPYKDWNDDKINDKIAGVRKYVQNVYNEYETSKKK